MVSLLSWWRRLQRAIDRRILLPQLIAQADSKQQVVFALGLHASVDPAYSDLSLVELHDLIREWVDKAWLDD
jgi:hypothetical protein